MNRIPLMKTSAAVIAATLLLASCGGSDGNGAPIDDGLTQMQREDRDASASVAGLFAFAVSLISTVTSDSSEPRTIDGITPPVAEDAEPAVIPL